MHIMCLLTCLLSDLRFLMDGELIGVYQMWMIQHIGPSYGMNIGQLYNCGCEEVCFIVAMLIRRCGYDRKSWQIINISYIQLFLPTSVPVNDFIIAKCNIVICVIVSLSVIQQGSPFLTKHIPHDFDLWGVFFANDHFSLHNTYLTWPP